MFGNNQGQSNQGTSNQGDGTNAGEGKQGNPVGQGIDKNGNGWSLKGRSLVGDLVKPEYNSNAEGKIVVEVWVDAEGKVISTSIAKGSTISDKTLHNAALMAASKAKFTKGEAAKQQGTITYFFKIN